MSRKPAVEASRGGGASGDDAQGVRVDVALPLPLFRTFTYLLPPGVSLPEKGTRVLVPFRRKEWVGWVVGPGSPAHLPGIRTVLDVLEPQPSVTPDVLKLARWVADYYMAPLGIALRSVLPALLVDVSRDYVSLVDTTHSQPGREEATSPQVGPPEAQLTPRERRIVEALRGRNAPVRVKTLASGLGMGSIWPEIRSLRARGAVVHETVAPREPKAQTQKVVGVVDPLLDLMRREEVLGRAPRQLECLQYLEAAGGALTLSDLVEKGGFGYGVVKGLEAKGVLAFREEEVSRDPFAQIPAGEPPDLTPTPPQAAALAALLEESRAKDPRPCLLHGITGSGKTLVYIHLLKEVVEKQGRGALVLVPEIALTPQTVSRFRAHFGQGVAVLHSGLSDGERFDAWRRLQDGTARIAVGARSAIFAPLADLGAIVVDEEHDSSYKQSEAPRYSARDLAVVRARESRAVCVLGSATPSLESWENVRKEKFRLLTLPERATGASLPIVSVVDLRKGRGGASPATATPGPRTSPKETARGEGGVILSGELVEAVRLRLERNEQTILLLNRRGYSSFVQCRECGEVQACRDCSVSLTLHRASNRLLCHHCRYEQPAPSRCPRCGSTDLSFKGVGTEQVERAVAATFAGARIARMDVDTTSGKWSHHEILGRVERGEVDILLGTQMIAKGLDFPRVTLVGVVNADVGLHLPDFRASERTFQLLSQVAGRAGRGSLGGEVILQTSVPEHYAVAAALTHDYEGFARRELHERSGPGYPPHRRMANVVVSSPQEDEAALTAEALTQRLRDRGFPGVEVTGPAPCPIQRLHSRWRWHLLLRAGSPAALAQACAEVVRFRPRGVGDVRIALDRDPVALL
ncbi:MAG: primosomal protein N' [Gemmatimonadota bacterium]